MKKLFFFIGLLTLFNILKAQEYEPIVDSTKMWVSYFRSSSQPFGEGYTVAFKFQGEVKLDTVVWTKVFMAKDSFYTNWNHIGYVHEENRIVSFQDKDDLIIDTLYDFNKVTNDTFDICRVFITDTNTFEIAGKKRFTQGIWGNHLMKIYHYEGLGSNSGILGPLNFCTVGLYTYLVCYYKDGEMLYMDTKFAECYFHYNSVNDKLLVDLNPSPNPTNGLIEFDLPEKFQKARLLLFDVLGKQAGWYHLWQGKNQINLSHLPQGIYSYVAKSGNNFIAKGKIIIN